MADNKKKRKLTTVERTPGYIPPKPIEEQSNVPERIGRPPIEVDYEQVSKLAGIGCTVAEIGAVLGLGESTVWDRLNRDWEFSEAYKRGREEGKETLRRAQWHKAINDGNPAMLIWLGKQILGQKDRAELKHEIDLARERNVAKKAFEAEPKLLEQVFERKDGDD